MTLLARDAGELERARRELTAAGGDVLVRACDIRVREEAEKAVRAVLRERGAIDVLVNNASVIQVGPFENCSPADFEEEIGLHFWGPLYLIRSVVPGMKRRGGGRIVNISSIGGLVAVPHLVPYSATKFALTGLSDGIRAELAKDGIRVTTVAPGLMRTGSHVNALFKGRQPEEYAWFAALAANRLISMNAGRAARRIVDACRYGKPYLVLSVTARILKTVNALMPGATAAVMKLAARLLPAPAEGAAGNERKTGWRAAPRFPLLLPAMRTGKSRGITRRWDMQEGNQIEKTEEVIAWQTLRYTGCFRTECL